MEPVRIDDPDDPRLDDYRSLKGRLIEQVVVVEGATALPRLLSSSLTIRSLLLLPHRHARLRDALGVLEAPTYVVEREVMARLAGFDVHRGVLAAAERPVMPTLADLAASSRTLVVLEGSNDVENIGAVARSARGLGIDGLVLDPTCADPYGRRAVRVSMGEILHLPVTRATTWPDDLDLIRRAGFEVWALTPDRGADNLWELPRPAQVALVAGAEGPGLGEPTMARSDRRVRIPMAEGADSLNLGHALAIAMAALMR